MQAIQVTCPNCGAGLRADEASRVVTCEYCNTVSTVQRRSRILERTVPPPALQVGMRVATQRHSPRWILGVLLVTTAVPLIAVGFGVRAAMRKQEDAQRQIDDATARARSEVDRAFAQAPVPHRDPAAEPPRWQGTNSVLVADIDGDGMPELIGRGRQVAAGDIVRLIALDPATGSQKWQSEPLGTYTDTYRGLLALAGDRVIYASEKAQLAAFAVRDGKRQWTGTLDERIKAFCAGATPGTIIAVGNDDKGRAITLADGTVGDAKPGYKPRTWHDPPPCTLLPSDGDEPYERMKTPGSLMTNKLQLGVDVEAVLPGPGVRIVSGARLEGTHVTMLVALEVKGGERWRTTVSPDPLGAEGAPRQVVVGEQETCAVYYGTAYHLACFALADGKRRWDVPVESNASGLFVVGRSLVMTAFSQLEVRDLDTGALKWSSH